MEATFSLSGHFYAKPIFARHQKRPPVLCFHVNHGYHTQPSSPRSFALQVWPTTIKAHRTMWAVNALPKAKGNGWDCMPSWPTQSKVSRKAWDINSLPTPNANGGDGARAWITAFIAMKAVVACVAGASMGMTGMMVTPPAIASNYVDQEIDVVVPKTLKEFLDVSLNGLPKGEGDDAVKKFPRQLGSLIEYPTLKKNARVALASGQAEEIMKILFAKFHEDLKIDGTEKALEIGLILIEMLILQGKPEDALSILKRSDFKSIIEQKGNKRDCRPYLYEAAANLLLDKPDEVRAREAWKKFAAASSPFQLGPKITFEELKNSITILKWRRNNLLGSRIHDLIRN